ncbi:MAG: UDP-N-acetylglucosamine pyrophosphorylase [Actinobacteria bacterium RBG_16_64_13]|nr:MAG: UDP-N-acetylglucosamine pyrophosphorylase [Actinobacteria bacterium RBG_16_64_13]
MDLQPRGYQKVIQLINKGVNVPNPLSLDIGDEVDVGRISGRGVTLFPGCRLYGARTAISAGVKLGAEGPVTIDDCCLGADVELKGGCFKQSVFLERANMGWGAEVREGCLLEEEAGGAHCVGLKQTILFPFVVLGSLVNFCDCLMAGGTSRKDHSEVGSSYIHFNYTPDGDKATASLFGDVVRGVMLDQARIFLGGQGGAVGPVRVGFGTVVAAGSILRRDVVEDGRLVVDGPPPDLQRRYVPQAHGNLTRVVRNNVMYLANLVALEQWYKKVRAQFFAREEMGELVYQGAVETLALAKAERIKHLVALAEMVQTSGARGRELRERAVELGAAFGSETVLPSGDGFPAGLGDFEPGGPGGYIAAIHGLTPGSRAAGVEWLGQIVDVLCGKAGALLRSMDLFGGGH